MLTPEYLAKCTDYLLGLYDELDRSIIADIARRIVKTGELTPTAKHQITAAQNAGMMISEITRQVSQVSGLSQKEVKRLFEEAAITGMQNDAKPLILNGRKVDIALSEPMRQTMQAAISKTNGDLRNLTLTTGVTATGKYQDAVNAAYMKVQSGAFSYTEAIKQAIREAASDGNYVQYASGHRDLLDVAVRRSVLTGLNQTAGKLTEMYGKDMGCEYYETSAHAGARPSHSVWQGRVFKIEGEEPGYPNFVESTGYGTGAGLCGWNCRHSFYPFFPGLSVPAYTKEKLDWYDAPRYEYNGDKLTEYEVSQLMRKCEREIRSSKRELAAMNAAMEETTDARLKEELKDEFEQKSVTLKEKEGKYRDLCKQTKHTADSARTGVIAVQDSSGNIVSWNRSSAQKARYGAERGFQKKIAGTGADIGGPETLAKRIQLRYDNDKESNLYDMYLRQVKSGMVSPLSTFGNYKKQYQAIEENVIGITASNGTEIKSQSNHFIERVIGTKEDPGKNKPRSGVSVDDILDALNNPVSITERKVDSKGRAGIKFIGEKASVSVNPDTKKLVQCNPTNHNLVRRLRNENGEI